MFAKQSISMPMPSQSVPSSLRQSRMRLSVSRSALGIIRGPAHLREQPIQSTCSPGPSSSSDQCHLPASIFFSAPLRGGEKPPSHAETSLRTN